MHISKIIVKTLSKSLSIFVKHFFRLCNLSIFIELSKTHIIPSIPNNTEIKLSKRQFGTQVAIELFIISNFRPNDYSEFNAFKNSTIVKYKNMEVGFNLVSNEFLGDINGFITSKKKIKQKTVLQNNYKSCFIYHI